MNRPERKRDPEHHDDHQHDPKDEGPLTDDELFALWVLYRVGRRLIWQQPGYEGFGEAFFYEGWFTRGGRNPYPPIPADSHIQALIRRGLLRSVGERLLPTEIQIEVEHALDVPMVPPTLIMVISDAGHRVLRDLPDWQRRALARFYDGPPAT